MPKAEVSRVKPSNYEESRQGACTTGAGSSGSLLTYTSIINITPEGFRHYTYTLLTFEIAMKDFTVPGHPQNGA